MDQDVIEYKWAMNPTNLLLRKLMAFPRPKAGNLLGKRQFRQARMCWAPYSSWRRNHGGGRQPMCDPEGCSTVWGAVGGGGDPHPPPKGGGGTPPPPLVDPNPAPFPAGPVQARKHTKLTRCTVNGHCFAALQHFQSSIECCLEFAQRPFLPLVTNHRHICREAKGATDI